MSIDLGNASSLPQPLQLLVHSQPAPHSALVGPSSSSLFPPDRHSSEEIRQIEQQRQQRRCIRELRAKMSARILENMNNSINYNFLVLLVSVLQVGLILGCFYATSGDTKQTGLAGVLQACLGHQCLVVIQQLIVLIRLQNQHYTIHKKQYEYYSNRQGSQVSLTMPDDHLIVTQQNPVVMQVLDIFIKITYLAILVYTSWSVIDYGSAQNQYDKWLLFTCTVILMVGYLQVIFIFIVVLVMLFCFVPFFLLIAIRTNYVKRFNKNKLDQYLKKQKTSVYYNYMEDQGIGSGQVEEDGHEMDFCFLCQKGYQEDSIVLALKCNSKHFFHSDCIKKWFLISVKCPICEMTIF